MSSNDLWQFPVPSNCINKRVTLYFRGANAIMKFDYFDEERDDRKFNGGITFEAVMSHRHSSEKFSKSIGAAYDTLIEITDSKWIDELKEISPQWAEYWKIKHYAIYLDGYGMYEFAARDFNVMQESEGELGEDI